MPRSILFIIILLAVVVGAVVLLSSQAREVPTRPMEVDVTNAAGN